MVDVEFNFLSKSEHKVHDYIQKKSSKGSVKESMEQIAEHLGISNATVHRAIRKLKEEGIISVVPTSEKTEANEIFYHGYPDPKDQVKEIMKLVNRLNLSAKRFQTMLEKKDAEIELLKKEKRMLYEEIDMLNQKIREMEREMNSS